MSSGFIFVHNPKAPNLLFYPEFNQVLYWATGPTGRETLIGDHSTKSAIQAGARRMKVILKDNNPKLRQYIFNQTQKVQDGAMSDYILKALNSVYNDATLLRLKDIQHGGGKPIQYKNIDKHLEGIEKSLVEFEKRRGTVRAAWMRDINTVHRKLFQ